MCLILFFCFFTSFCCFLCKNYLFLHVYLLDFLYVIVCSFFAFCQKIYLHVCEKNPYCLNVSLCECTYECVEIFVFNCFKMKCKKKTQYLFNSVFGILCMKTFFRLFYFICVCVFFVLIFHYIFYLVVGSVVSSLSITQKKERKRTQTSFSAVASASSLSANSSLISPNCFRFFFY